MLYIHDNNDSKSLLYRFQMASIHIIERINGSTIEHLRPKLGSVKLTPNLRSSSMTCISIIQEIEIFFFTNDSWPITPAEILLSSWIPSKNFFWSLLIPRSSIHLFLHSSLRILINLLSQSEQTYLTFKHVLSSSFGLISKSSLFSHYLCLQT